MSPIVVSQWVHRWYWAFLFTFVQVVVLWSLNLIAVEIQNPFGLDANDIDGRQMQMELNRCLMLLLEPESSRTPTLTEDALLCASGAVGNVGKMSTRMGGFQSVWETAENRVS